MALGGVVDQPCKWCRPRARGVIAVVVAVAALVVAALPWLGIYLPAADRLLAPAWPLVPILVTGALVMARGRGYAAIVALAALGVCVPTLLAQPRPAMRPQAGFPLRVVTHNVSINNVDPVRTAAVLEGSRADILLLQETEGRFASALPMLARTFPYASRCNHRCALTILSRYPIEPIRRHSPDRLWKQINPGMMLDVRIRLPGNAGIVPVASVHLARGQTTAADLRQRAGLTDAMRQAKGYGTIMGGDFNMVPWSARMHSLDRTLAPLARVTSSFSWPARFWKRSAPLPLVPIDHVYTGSGWTLSGVRRLERTGSDHYPISVDLIWHGSNAMIPDAH